MHIENGCFGDHVRQWRHGNRWTQQRLAEELGYDVSYVAKIEQGRRRPSRQFIARLADVLAPTGQPLPIGWRQPSDRIRLPVPSTPVIGRDDDIERICQLLKTTAGWVTIVGAPGVGKTTLAVEVAWRLAKDVRHGTFFVSLAEVGDSASVPGAVAAAVGVVQHAGAAPVDILTEVFRSRQALVVLDNFEHVLPARQFVEALAREAPHVRILITSREALHSSEERQYRLGPLAFPEPGSRMPERPSDYSAVEVFVTRARSLRPSFSLTEASWEAVADVCARLDGLPLAISLAASAVGILSPSDIAASLRNRLDLPTGAPSEDETTESLATALQWSWDLLQPQERVLLSRLAVFNGGCTLAAAEAVCGDDDNDVLAAMTGLARKHLVEVAYSDNVASRFSLLETVRRFGLERLGEYGDVALLRRRHAEYFVGLSEAGAPHVMGGTEQARWIRLLDDEYANLAGAFGWALEHDRNAALRLGVALWRFFSMRRTGEGRAWLKAVLEKSDECSLQRLGVAVGAAVLARLQADLVEADALLGRALDDADRLGATAERALAVLNQGIVDEQRGDYDRAEARFLEALRLSSTLGDERAIGHALNCLGVIALHRGEIEEASPLFLEAMRRFRALHDAWSVAVTATNLGWIAETTDLLSESQRWYTESRQLWEALGDRHGLARSLADLGRVSRRQKDWERAAQLLREALQHFQGIGDRRLIATALLELAAVVVGRREHDLAARLVGAADGVRAALHAPAWRHEQTLEEEILAKLEKAMDCPTIARARGAGRTLSVDDAVELAEAGTWPPRAQRAAPVAPNLWSTGRDTVVGT